MNTIPFIFNLYSKAKENNKLSGIIIYDIIAFLAYVINPFSLVYPGDLDIIFGGIASLIFTLKNRKKDQSSLKLGVSIGLLGALISAISISIYEWIYVIIVYGFDLSFLLVRLITFLILALVIGLLLGVIFGYIYSGRPQKVREDSKDLDQFLDDLK